MPDNIIAEMRQLLQEMIVPDLKALTYKVDGLQKQIELTERSMATRFNAFRDELAEFRAELTTFRTEMGDLQQIRLSPRLASEVRRGFSLGTRKSQGTGL